MRPALIHNPNSRRNQQDGGKFVAFARGKLGKFCVCSQHDEHLPEHIRELKKDNVDLIMINGGDGTVSACLTAIAAIYPEDNLPAIAILPAGNTNLIASDVGFGLRGPAAVDYVMAGKALKSSERSPIRLSWHDGSQPSVLGMFGGCTGYARAIRIAHEPTVIRFAPHDLAVIYTFLTSVVSLFFARSRNSWMKGNYLKREVFPPCERGDRDGDSFLFIATALEKLSRGIWPFWSDKRHDEGFHFLDVASFPKNLPKVLGNLLRGRVPNWLQQHEDYKSDRAIRIALETDSDFVLDGEVFPAKDDRRIFLEKGPSFRFLHV
ncbi:MULTISPECIES: diacylglycerol kinase family protein [unclassified Saccharibacter]|uniref:diacylglycerol/lipid kinase family protein n=1 Tax=unclassified Saccharibacter TaxID=2648722 RepID=UPI001321B68D|nr:hypothetical protein [Saccharibacter sp. EH611]MXV57850.1 hypothetical protein [Saccharibacter sp. EH70]MXV65236.1 hypothetical protein [Saccharibacter sp. EH60]